ncbi:hypothetical protein HanXRQr2_Chr12g0538951 [Helianthus annuus]|uniref:Uncharacterized protein n=1 Tax=Helianthus annuus TaxID=4232 RepID=A0A9K3MVV1_HELAN|nr:hypothetical protein HanXRQr2_Chr12g0538951 [Helianthus annuus]KAJ0492943.1 hypothetical protein HanIR_Chr12g0580531 [Helianthus annuus]KAJ0862483.1 hypothetical protein HanPSC8_Chr12g0518761 [Helianthus annuus]
MSPFSFNYFQFYTSGEISKWIWRALEFLSCIVNKDVIQVIRA